MFTKEKILTSELKGQRTLAAIVFTDVVGYSALMAANEEYTLDLLRRDFQLMKQLCQRFEGRVLKTIGDALLLYFPSAVKAVNCAQEMQLNLAEIAAKLAPEDVLTHRIGIHLGDVFFNGTDVMGDGVNVAARLQAEAQPGGICLSQTVYEVVKTPLSLKATDLVPKKLKNIPESVLVYQIPPIYPTPFTTQWENQDSISNESESLIYSSGQWVLLDEHFFQIETYSHNPDGKLTIQILSKSVQDDATLQSLRPYLEQSQLIKFAYQNDGLLVKIKSIEAVSRQDYQIWTLTLEPKHLKTDANALEQTYKGRKQFYSVDDIAQLKARRLLLNDPPKLLMLQDAQMFSPALAEREMLENLIRTSSTSVSVEDCVIHSLYPIDKDKPKTFLELARLKAIFFLKAAGIVEQVLELSLGPIYADKVHVRFRGRRRQVYLDIEPTVIEIEGDCPLVSEV
ncbi:MAG TPA: adenylate/guanylate cyclase domain-containing protein [Coleofasciculaceae cyanobacterium]|jgi:class 3 adenylate cyclase